MSDVMTIETSKGRKLLAHLVLDKVTAQRFNTRREASRKAKDLCENYGLYSKVVTLKVFGQSHHYVEVKTWIIK